MKVNYNIQKEERKAMVAVVSKVLGEKPVYSGAPTFSYKIGAFEITKDGNLCFDDALDEATVARVRTALREAGFTSEGGEHEASCADTGADEPIQTETAAEPAPTEEATAEQPFDQPPTHPFHRDITEESGRPPPEQGAAHPTRLRHPRGDLHTDR